jgi:hypothetical protein
MSNARTLIACAIAATILLLAQIRVRADYMSEIVLLNSQNFQETVGSVIGAANNGKTAVNGLLPGQVRLTFSINPIAYARDVTQVGFAAVFFNSDLALHQVAVPPGWSLSPVAEPAGSAVGSPSQTQPVWPWAVVSNTGTSSSSQVTVLISGLGDSATLNHLLCRLRLKA